MEEGGRVILKRAEDSSFLGRPWSCSLGKFTVWWLFKNDVNIFKTKLELPMFYLTFHSNLF